MINSNCADGGQQTGRVAGLLLTKMSTMDSKFLPGDKVRLKSGGPVMTIRGPHFDVLANIYSREMLDCIWFAKNKDGKEEVHYCPFNQDELEKVPTAA
jgi:uncharacterized protein YodC (DUF2158 family)